MGSDYVHQELGKEVQLPSGRYCLLRELKLKHRGRKVLCLVGVGILECACCTGGCSGPGGGGPYVLVPGYVISWKSSRNGAGLPVSEVEPVADGAARREIETCIRGIEGTRNIEFWH
jgi:hypothetical protein